MKKVGIFTTFFEADSGYSLVSVASTQIRMLLDNGYDPVVLVQENFKSTNPLWGEEVIDLRRCIPYLELTADISEQFEERMQAIRVALEENLADVDVCIAHDVILQEFYKEHNVAMRLYAETRPDLLWLHWIHSCPGGSTITIPRASWATAQNCRHNPPPGYIIYPNSTDEAIVARTYKVPRWKVRTCRAAHSIDPLLVWPYDPLTRDLAQQANLLGGEVTAVYPARLDRGKQPEKIIRLLAGIKYSGRDVRLLVVDWQSTGERFQEYIDELLGLAAELDLEDEVYFTSRLDDRCSEGVPRRVVLDLMDLTNVYIHPSSVETYSLVVHEAMLRGNLVCLNYDFPAMRELFGDLAIYFDFGSDRCERTYMPDEQAFWNEEALRLVSELEQNRAIRAQTEARREWNPQTMFREIEPLFYLTPVGA